MVIMLILLLTIKSPLLERDIKSHRAGDKNTYGLPRNDGGNGNNSKNRRASAGRLHPAGSKKLKYIFAGAHESGPK